MKVLRLSALRTGRLYPPGNIPDTHFCWKLSRHHGHSAAGRIMSMKNSHDTIGNRTRYLRRAAGSSEMMVHTPLENFVLTQTTKRFLTAETCSLKVRYVHAQWCHPAGVPASYSLFSRQLLRALSKKQTETFISVFISDQN
jgi:hypothetical protein